MKKNLLSLGLITTAVACFSASPLSAQSTDPAKPNIIWIMLEDWCPDLSCYGTKGIETPNMDALAADGVRYTAAFTTAPVCSSSRSAMMTGFYQNYIGCGQHRTDKKNKKSSSVWDQTYPAPA